MINRTLSEYEPRFLLFFFLYGEHLELEPPEEVLEVMPSPCVVSLAFPVFTLTGDVGLRKHTNVLTELLLLS